MKIHYVFLVILLVLNCLIQNCKSTPIEPEPRIKTPREMTWTADTLPVPEGAIQVLPEDLLVLSPKDIWLATWVGHGVIMHYDGANWAKVEESGSISCLTGTVNDIWAGGYASYGGDIYLSHYDGNKWNRINMNIKGELLDMTKDADGNIWACGRNGVVLKYDKTKWIADTIKIGYKQAYPEVEYFIRSIEEYNSKHSVIAWIVDFNRLRNIYYYITGDISNWVITDSTVSESSPSIMKFGNWGLYKVNEEKLYSCGGLGIWEMRNSNWEKIYNTSSSIYSISGINDSYIIAVGDFQQLLFYDGNSWENFAALFPQIDHSFVCTNTWTNGYETIIVGYGDIDGIQKTVVWHNK